jgi:hypothetical protein
MKDDPIPMEQVMAAAEQDGLGALLESLAWDDANTFRRTAGRRVHRFEHGLVVPTKKGPLTLPYRDLRIYRDETRHINNNVLQYVSTDWMFQRRDGTVWKTLLTRGRRETADSALAALYEQALTTTCVQQRDEAWQRLAEGATLTFGSVVLDISQMTLRGVSVPWTRVRGVSIHKGTLMFRVSQDGRWIKERDISAATIGAIPNFPLLWELVQAAHGRALAEG